ncbi:MAG: DUF6398 domain-containing protein [Paraclostridium sp.]
MNNKEKLKEIKSLINRICEEHLNKDIEKTCNKLIKKLMKNNEFSIEKGNVDGWVAGIIVTVGEDSGLFHSKSINRFKDNLYISRAELSRIIGVSITTVKSREKYIRSFLAEKNRFIADIKCEENTYIPTMKEIENMLKDKFIREQLEAIFEYENIDDMIYEEEYEETENEKNIQIYMDKASDSENIGDAIENVKKAMKYAKKEIDNFDENKGHFWGIHETRSYMMCKDMLAELYFNNGQIKESIKEYKEMLELNEMDNQGVRYKLINLLVLSKDDDLFNKLIKEFPEETTLMLYPIALYYFYKKDIFNSKRYIKKALESNIFVPELVFGLRDTEEDIFAYGLGSEEEAMAYFNHGGMMWISVKGANEWLFDEYTSYCLKNKCGLDIPKEAYSEIKEELKEANKRWLDICDNIFKIN